VLQVDYPIPSQCLNVTRYLLCSSTKNETGRVHSTCAADHYFSFNNYYSRRIKTGRRRRDYTSVVRGSLTVQPGTETALTTTWKKEYFGPALLLSLLLPAFLILPIISIGTATYRFIDILQEILGI